MRVTDKARQRAVLEALRAFYERVQAGDRCPRRSAGPCRYTGYPRETARCRFCGRRRDGTA